MVLVPSKKSLKSHDLLFVYQAKDKSLFLKLFRERHVIHRGISIMIGVLDAHDANSVK
jgi:hypothetical protein